MALRGGRQPGVAAAVGRRQDAAWRLPLPPTLGLKVLAPVAGAAQHGRVRLLSGRRGSEKIYRLDRVGRR
jgi:hypothetical protein